MQNSWLEENQKYLSNQINYIKKILEMDADSKSTTLEDSEIQLWNTEITSSSPSLEYLSRLFGLSVFEKYVLVLCVGSILDSKFKQLLGKNNSGMTVPTFEFALSILPHAHWSAISPESPLRRLHLISVENTSNTSVTSAPIQIDERILHYLTGINYLDSRLHGIVSPVKIEKNLIKSNQSLVKNIVDSFQNNKKLSVIQMVGSDTMNKKIVASDVCEKMGLNLWKLLPTSIPVKIDEMESFTSLWNRESALLNAGLYIQAEDVDSNQKEIVDKFLGGRIGGPIFLGTQEGWVGKNMDEIDSFTIQVKKPQKAEQKTLWEQYLSKFHGVDNFENTIEKITNQFDFDSHSIHQASNTVHSALDLATSFDFHKILWEACRQVSRPKMSDLAQNIVPKYTMDNLVLPEKEKNLLYEIIHHIKNKEKVYSKWGFEDIGSRGLGTVSLFAGESGTGKTMAAEAIASELKLDLFRN